MGAGSDGTSVNEQLSVNDEMVSPISESEEFIRKEEMFAYFTFFWQGIGSLFPWNAFITSSYYFRTRFCNTPYEHNFENYFTVPFTMFQTIGLAIVLQYGSYFELQDMSLYPLVCFAIIFVFMSYFVVLDVDENVLFVFTLFFTCLCGGACAIMQGGIFGLAAKFPPIYTSALMSGQALAGLLAAVMSFITSSTRSTDFCHGDVIYTCLDGETDYSTLFFFMATVIIMLCCIITLVKMLSMETVKPYISPVCTPNTTPVRKLRKSYEKLRRNSNSASSIPNELAFQNNDNSNMNKNYNNDGFGYTDLRDEYRIETGVEMPACPSRSPEVSLQFPKIYVSQNGNDNGNSNSKSNLSVLGGGLSSGSSSYLNYDIESDTDGNTDIHMEMTKLLANTPSRQRHSSTSYSTLSSERILPASPSKNDFHHSHPDDVQHNPGRLCEICQIISRPALAVFLNFTFTITVFPSIVVRLYSQYECTSGHRVFDDLYVPALFVLYNVADLIGRLLSESYEFTCIDADNIWLVSAYRVVFVPLFLMCRIRSADLPNIFESDLWQWTFMIIFGLSNGFVASKSMVLGPQLVDKDEAALAGTIMVWCLTLGLLFGSLGAFILRLYL